MLGYANAVIFVALALSSVSANYIRTVPSGEFTKRSLHHGMHRRAGASNAAEFAKIQDPAQQCSYYDIPELTKMLKSHQFPKVSHIASIPEGDTQAQQVWQDIQNSGIIPKEVKVKGHTDGKGHSAIDLAGYDGSADPDCWWSASTCKKPKHANIPSDVYTCKEPNTWGLTFDDGPNCSHNAFYDFLQKENLKATLFYIGTNIVTWPLQAQRGLVDGHDICGHTWAHRAMTTLSDEQVFAELYYTSKAIKHVTGVTTSCWRPPYGDVDDRVRAIAAGLGLRTILWQDDTDDWNVQPEGDASVQKIDQNYEKIIGKADKESPIVLTHEINEYTMKEFQRMFPKVKAAYTNVVPLTACTNVTKPYVEDITYPDFGQLITGGKATGLPGGDSIQFDADQSAFKVVSFSQQENGFGHIGRSRTANNPETSSSSAPQSTPNSSFSDPPTNESDTKEGTKSGAATLSGALTFLAGLGSTALFAIWHTTL
ncbi:hypothetical protein MVES1_003879 [Malassezia vespertilionis]|uniref:chitin deacetylase n=1 Tax=Malassezia vespertilionis TaxID=2020962 RepID=A0A2N1J7Y2_9BASI|nr:uncharacterized protein MVES1_003879 [Malassezia vespertilionis]PKI82572.1 hypothetical protein MVES_003436 [Malassezia vespertilionis]WFD08503.1 hypothetical protein MVES1_003879 [Malassezia vespertilionis]